MKLAVVFQGQGSQSINMGNDFYNEFSSYREIIDYSYSLNSNLKQAITNDEIHKTCNSQPIILANQIGILEVIKNKYNLKVDATAGFSLGEYTSFYLSGVLSLEEVFDIVLLRAKLMDTIKSDYELKVCMGLTLNQLKELKLKHDFLISNVNLEKQILIGSTNFLELSPILKEAGAKRIIDMNLSGPFHTEEFRQIAKEFVGQISSKFNTPSIDLFLNYNASKYDGESFLEIMENQMCQSVLWYEQVQNMIADGVDTFLEIGSNPVVSNMIKKINKEVKVITISKVEDLEKLEELCQNMH